MNSNRRHWPGPAKALGYLCAKYINASKHTRCSPLMKMVLGGIRHRNWDSVPSLEQRC